MKLRSLSSPCPPNLCDCQRERLQSTEADLRILQLTQQEEQRLLDRLENLRDFADLKRLQERLHEQLGIHLKITPGAREVRSSRGLEFHFAECPGLCRKTRQAISAAIRRSLQNNPEILWRLLDSHDLLG